MGQQVDDHDYQFIACLQPAQRGALGDAERFAAGGASTPLFILTVAHDVTCCDFAPVETGFIWAEFFSRVHLFSRKLTRFVTNKFADDPLFYQSTLFCGATQQWLIAS